MFLEIDTEPSLGVSYLFPEITRAESVPMTAHRKTGRPSLGDRVIMTVPLPLAVLAIADAAAADHGIDRSALLADICCYHYGRPDLMRHLTQQVLAEPHTEAAPVPLEGRQPGPHVKVRPPRVIADMIIADHQRRAMSRPALLVDICCYHLGFPDLVRELYTIKEGLPLAI
ncbi:hypothetical protein ACX9NJ_27675 [Mycobacterium sp. ML2]